MSTIFSKIISGEIPCHKIAENDQFLAFLDVFPLAVGHTLVIPKLATDYLYDLEDQTLADLFIFSKKIAHAIRAAFPCPKVGTAVIGLEVAHAHVHLVPMQQVSDLNFAKAKLTRSPDELAQDAQRIISFL